MVARTESKAANPGKIVVPGAKRTERTVKIPARYEARVSALYSELIDHAYLMADLLAIDPADVESVVDGLELDARIRALKAADEAEFQARVRAAAAE